MWIKEKTNNCCNSVIIRLDDISNYSNLWWIGCKEYFYECVYRNFIKNNNRSFLYLIWEQLANVNERERNYPRCLRLFINLIGGIIIRKSKVKELYVRNSRIYREARCGESVAERLAQVGISGLRFFGHCSYPTDVCQILMPILIPVRTIDLSWCITTLWKLFSHKRWSCPLPLRCSRAKWWKSLKYMRAVCVTLPNGWSSCLGRRLQRE